ncbi:bacteriophage f237 ORF10 [Vibrio astriarenae]|nr:bacteriophage f237 ORF10 [Vibrio sp. C7]
MYQSKLLDAYKKAKNYVQDKQIAHDLNMTASRISEMRKGRRYISDSEAVFLAEGAGLDPEMALLGCHADRTENPSVKAIWENMAKKFNRHGLQGISMACGGLALVASRGFGSVYECALYVLC